MFDVNKFDHVAFNQRFDADIEAVKGAEKITREKLKEMSRYMLEQLHTCEDVRPVNSLLRVLTPVNKKVAILFFKAFTGFKWNDDMGEFTKKSTAKYDDARNASIEFLEDPMNNLWTWANRNVEIQAKEFDLKQVTKAVERFVKKANEAKVPQEQLIRAILDGGLDMTALIGIMEAAANQE